jgi:hypothetical protein
LAARRLPAAGTQRLGRRKQNARMTMAVKVVRSAR